MSAVLVIIGFLITAATLSALVWSIAYPARRIWPPKTYSAWTPIVVWVPTLALFGTLIALGVIGWGQMGLPTWLRYGVGIPIVVLSNVVVWSAVHRFGIAQTGGAEGTLKTDGLYRYSRNPQYVADAFMVFGWLILSASPIALVVGILAIAGLMIAPFAEEPWLRERFGREFNDYCARTRRYL
jgi:protein-S-isoprenylcysteine O-methyltransferase Ste14